MRIPLYTILLLALISVQANAQGLVSGVVKSASDGSTIPGATVVVKGTTTGTVTDLSGAYSVNVPGGSNTLVFSFVGMKTLEVAIDGRTKIDVSLETDVIGIDEVVVIGYASTRKQDLSVAASTIKIGDNNKGRPASLGNLIQGQMSGVKVTQSGDPTAEAAISIRGKGNKAAMLF
ncbi:MAG: carboxypeptidase-like regulatory domain-containing protein [Lentimicrobium sp.]|uniref:carboxypeptidase-like regulatory domain-containing protein n=1 Tax=Lentimicrobium sp. TaxID=2034841 RepID=UPI0025F6EF0D|nr:carboxypeptidase-like regulatory domain-containing protein [Lentimicrobium sp.]MCO5256870.1 carboxypeptidase-like regulatory domain-containing protein [Lentimicrobium sp.]